MIFQKYFSTTRTPQSMPIPGTTQVPNSAGGYSWVVNEWTRLDRFLILGSEAGTYYIREQKLTLENAAAVRTCIQQDGQRVVQRVVEISQAGRAPKNDPALFVLAMCAGLGTEATRQAAFMALPKVARTGTHLFHFLAYAELFRGWGRGLRRAVAHWYNRMPAGQLAYQAIKYQQRAGWSHRDALRLAHPKAAGEARNDLYRWLTHGWTEVPGKPQPDEGLRTLWVFEQAKRATSEADICALIQQYGLPWEAVPAQWLGSAAVWQALLPHLPLTALLRNLARMTANGLLIAGADATDLVSSRLVDEQPIRKALLHPLAILAALKTYAQGHGERGKLRWQPVASVVDALDRAFYLSFGNVTPTGKRLVLALDVSGSMDGGMVAGVPGLTPRVAAAAMALITAATEAQHTLVAFSAGQQGYGGRFGGGEPGIKPVDISPRQRLDDVVKRLQAIPMGGTDCSLPMRWALQHKVSADAFVIYTDNETWAGQIHPAQALQEYRRRLRVPAKLVVVGMTSNGFSIADPNDAGMLDVVGFDSAAPQLIADFVAG